MSKYNHPSLLVLLQLTVNILLNTLALSRFCSGQSVSKRLRDAAPYCLPGALTLVLARVLTYISFSKVPASLTQTVKASTPVFTVVMSYVMYGTRTRRTILLTLIPIIIGVALVAATELQFNLGGFVSALMASMISVLQSFATKSFFTNIGPDASPLIFNLGMSIMAASLLVPANLVDFWHTSEEQAESEAITRTLLLQFLVSTLANWLQTVSSIFVLKRLKLLSHQVTGVLRRLVIILTSLLYFQTEVTPLKILGIFTAVGGFASYGWVTKKIKSKYDDKQISSSKSTPKAVGCTDCEKTLSSIV